jgi:hypothetical protein
VKLVLISPDGSQATQLRARAAGATALVSDPPRPEELRGLMNDALA